MRNFFSKPFTMVASSQLLFFFHIFWHENQQSNDSLSVCLIVNVCVCVCVVDWTSRQAYTVLIQHFRYDAKLQMDASQAHTHSLTHSLTHYHIQFSRLSHRHVCDRHSWRLRLRAIVRTNGWYIYGWTVRPPLDHCSTTCIPNISRLHHNTLSW